MQVDLPEGMYIVAVSGGIDSVVLLDMLAKCCSGSELIVAHFDHGIRADSKTDVELVCKLAAKYGLQFVTERAELGLTASEATARTARYEFLRRVRSETHADAIVTAHHQDDVLETMLLNLIRGTKWRGLQSLQSRADVKRPLLDYSKAQILDYAMQQDLEWREDSTNTDTVILRNYLRHTYIPELGETERLQLLHIRNRSEELTRQIDEIVVSYLSTLSADKLPRQDFIELSDDVALEILIAWLRLKVGGVEVTTKMLKRILAAIRTGRTGSLVDIKHGVSLRLTRNEAILVRPDIRD